jgi:zinc protease
MASVPAHRPAPDTPRGYRFPREERRVLENGLRLIVARLEETSVTSVLVTLDAGGEREERISAGLGALTAQGLLEGTTQLDADQLAARSERLGAQLEVNTSWTSAECGLTVRNGAMRDALTLLREVIASPRFPADGVNRLRDERLAELAQQDEEPRGLADDRMLLATFGDASRYGLPLGGDAPRVAALEPTSVQLHHRELYHPDNATLIVVGDVEPDVVLGWANEAWQDWQGRARATGRPASPSVSPEPRVTVVTRDHAPQSEIRVGHISLARNHPDFYAMSVMNAILGGLFNSRINLNLRERHGFTYGAFSALSWRRTCSLFEVSTAVRSDATGAAVAEILGEMERIQDQLVTEAELELAREYLKGVFPIRFETTSAVADGIATRESFGHHTGYFDDYRERIGRIETRDIRRVAQTYLTPAQARIVVVGDPSVIVSGLGGFGDVEVLPSPASRQQ